MISPITGNGMSMALQAGELAARPIASYSAGAIRWEEARTAVAQETNARFARRLAWGFRLQQLLFSHTGRTVLRFMSGADWAWRRVFAATR